jgi:hypothetical protein
MREIGTTFPICYWKRSSLPFFPGNQRYVSCRLVQPAADERSGPESNTKREREREEGRERERERERRRETARA